MSEQLAQLEKKGGGGNYKLKQEGTYTINSNITAKVGDVLIFFGNINGTPTPTNMTHIADYSVTVRPSGGVTAQTWVYIATNTTCKLNLNLWEGSCGYIHLTK